MSNLNEKPSKTNGIASDPVQRLTSYKSPRDLTLGGVRHKPNKKVFTPNLIAYSARKKTTSTNNATNQKNIVDKGRKDRKNDRPKNFKNTHIKSNGIFSDGLGSTERVYSRGSYEQHLNSPAAHKPTIRIKNNMFKVDKDVEDQKIKKVYGDLGIDDQIINDFRKTLEIDEPVKLPMDDGGPMTGVKSRSIVTIKKEPVIKQEPLENGYPPMELEKKPLVDIKMDIYEDSDVVNLLRTDESTVMLLQFPDTLPGRGGSTDDDSSRKNTTKGQSSTSSPDNKNEVVEEEKCHLSNLEEGCIGKIRIHRSGRVTFLLGNTTFEVATGTKTAFYQEIVSMAVDEDSRSANLISLGPFQHKLTIVPDWDKLFADVDI